MSAPIAAVDVKLIEPPSQTGVFELAIGVTGVGFTVIVKFIVFPVHPFAEGETEIIAEIEVVPLFVAVNEGILPVPLAPKPIAVLLLVQLYMEAVPAKTIGAITVLLQTD